MTPQSAPSPGPASSPEAAPSPEPASPPGRLRLPDRIRACLFDLDGVLATTAQVHAAAWKETFDELLRDWARRNGVPFVPFDLVRDYDDLVDGKPRLEGVRSFLAERGIELPEGLPSDTPDTATLWGVGNAKNERVLAAIAVGGASAYPGSVQFLQAVRAAGMHVAVVSSSANAPAVLTAAGLIELVDVLVDGNVAHTRHLVGKPAPDTFLAAAADLGCEPRDAAVFEDAQAGVAAGRAGGFGWVVGVDRRGQRQELLDHGADVVVLDLSELLA